MQLDLKTIEALAPDQASLGAAAKLTKRSTWPRLETNEQLGLVWGECQTRVAPATIRPWPVAALGIPVFACTPDHFPDMMAAALRREDIGAWVAGADIKLIRADADTPGAAE